jgi:hypothetical protein
MIELSSNDVIGLYGRYLFVIPNEGKQTVEQSAEEQSTVEQEVMDQETVEQELIEVKPEPVAEKAVASPELTTGIPVIWKMRTQSRIAMVMDEGEFKNRAMTIVLKDCVERAGMDTNLIGFGVLKGGETSFDFSQQPVPFALAFSPQVSEKEVIQLPEGQEVYPMPTVSAIVLNQDNQAALISLLRQLNERL